MPSTDINISKMAKKNYLRVDKINSTENLFSFFLNLIMIVTLKVNLNLGALLPILDEINEKKN